MKKIRSLKKAKQTKKDILIRLMNAYQHQLPLGVAAKALYGKDGELERSKVINLLGAYRSARLASFHVHKNHIVPLG